MSERLAIITTHPIQYNAPLFKLLAERKKITLKVFYTFSQAAKGGQFDSGFGKEIEWDIPLLEGYEYEFIDNVAKKPGTYHFSGVINPTLNNKIESWKPDAILVYGWSFMSHLKCMKKFYKKIPIIFRGDSNLIDEKWGLKKNLRNVFLKWVYRHTDFALYVGTANKFYYLQNGLKENQLLFAPHSIDNDRFSFNEQQLLQNAQKRRIEMGIADDDIVFLFAGKLERKKNPELLIKAFQKIEYKAHLVIVGNGPLENNLKLNYISDNIHFIDFQNQSEMPSVYRIGDVFVLPSEGPNETWGLSVNEAMASGLPVIVSDKSGCAFDLVENERNGYIFQSKNLPDLLAKMKLMLNKSELVRMSECSKLKIIDWSILNYSLQLENIVLNFI